MMKQIAVILIAWSVLLASPAGTWAASDVHVSTSGNDSTGDGTAGNPYATIQKGVDMVDVGGTVHVADGTYGANAATGKGADITKSLTLLGESRDGTIIDGSIGGVGTSSSYWAKGIHVNAASNVMVKNFTVSGFAGDGTSTGAYGVLFRDYTHDDLAEGLVAYTNNTVENVKTTNSYAGIYSLVNETLTVKDCLVQNSAADGLFIARASHNATIEGNTVTGSGNHGIWFGQDWAGVAGSDGGLVKNNTVATSVEGGITISKSDGTTVTDNEISGTDPSTLGWDPWAVGALSIMDESTNITVVRNDVHDNQVAGIGIGTPGGGSTLTDILIGGAAADHNDVYDNAGGGVWFRNATCTSNIEITYNNLYGNTGDDFDCLDGGGITSTVTADARYNWWGADGDPVVAGALLFDSPGDSIQYCDWAGAPVPEPATMGLLAAGTALLAVIRRRRRRRG